MGTYIVKYWTGTSEFVVAPSAHDAAVTIWGESHMRRHAIDPELLDTPDTEEILSEFGDFVATVKPFDRKRKEMLTLTVEACDAVLARPRVTIRACEMIVRQEQYGAPWNFNYRGGDLGHGARWVFSPGATVCLGSREAVTWMRARAADALASEF